MLNLNIGRNIWKEIGIFKYAFMSASQTRYMATLREIEGRLKSIRNIEKITKTMKTVASTKLTHSQKAMEKAKVYCVSHEELFVHSKTKALENSKTLYVVCSSDKGLCGGVHSQVTRMTRRLIEKDPKGQIIVLGDKAKMQLSRYIPQNIAMSFSQVGKNIPKFSDAQAIAHEILLSKIEFDKIDIIYNHLKSSVSYVPVIKTVYSEHVFKNSENINIYEIEDNILSNLKEFSLATSIFSSLVESHACEISARRNAMDSASKNALEMIKKFQISYNRQRQIIITTELIDIITDFLRLSRAQLDDSIVFHLNSLSVPKSFTPESIKMRSVHSNASLQPNTEACVTFIQKLFSVWNTRSSLLMYCEAIADETNVPTSSYLQNSSSINQTQSQKTDNNIIKRLIDQEKQIESVVRDHSWKQILKRCGFIQLNKTHEEAMQEWTKMQQKAQTYPFLDSEDQEKHK
ncbi:hypothetical protein PORY_000319 [Pneumocystis oryctolagi]|uniref:Uncharacterized protein n=1 Tax=Pneumocystis oryctolagi TaxID=42067 RepID=A0ACB7CEU9_9ASCO|nr:hypothetical protein PORY_000319 [Pneumocystis oryctolagi]